MWNQVSYDPRGYIMNTIYAIMYIEAWKNPGLQRGLNP